MVYDLDCNPKAKMFGKVSQKQGAWHTGLECEDNIVLYCTEGIIHMQIGETVLRVQPTDLLLIPANTFYRPLAGGSCQYFFFHFAAAPLPDTAEIPSSIAIAPHTKLKKGYAYTCTENYASLVRLPIHAPSAPKHMEELFHKAEMLKPNRSFSDQLLLDNLLRELLIEMGKATAPRGNRHLSEIRSFIDRNYSQSLTLSSLAETFSLSQSYIARLFRTELGMKPSQYINRIRISAAKAMLAQTDLPVAEIAEAVGYADIYYFSHVFKQVTGLTPSSFRSTSQSMLV